MTARGRPGALARTPGVSRPIASSRPVAAPPAVVHRLLADVEAWALWSPHVAEVRPATGTVAAGWRGQVRPWFAPRPTTMVVDAADPGAGLLWHSPGFGHTLRYEHRVAAAGDGSVVTFTARVEGPLGGLLTALARPVSAFGQRRRLARLDHLARLVARTAG